MVISTVVTIAPVVNVHIIFIYEVNISAYKPQRNYTLILKALPQLQTGQYLTYQLIISTETHFMIFEQNLEPLEECWKEVTLFTVYI